MISLGIVAPKKSRYKSMRMPMAEALSDAKLGNGHGKNDHSDETSKLIIVTKI
jgi:hypothetical protein